MFLQNHLPGQPVSPLQILTLQQVPPGLLTISDGRGRAYFSQNVSGEVSFTAGGAAGWHTAKVTDENGAELACLQFRLEPRTELRESSGQFRELLDICYYTMADEALKHYTRYQGKTYYYLVDWLRDHVHTLKGMKYFEPKVRSGIELYRDSQREDGMIWDNVHRREPPGTSPNHWGVRFQYGGFERTFEDGTAQFTRIPVENDVEYLFVEGIYYTWKATGDTAWMVSCLEPAIRALEYTVNSPYRWSAKYGLLKRGHTIDTWDFQNEEDCLSDFANWPDPMAIHPEKTRFGIMFGDNTGYAAACEYLAEMLETVGRTTQAATYRQRAAEIRQRLNELSWNGRFFTHHVPEDPNVKRDLGVDESTQISLSNTYSLNRRIAHEQAAAILRTYRELKDNLPPGSPGEWYLIYPPFPKGYNGHCPPWQYMNGGVSPIAAGELAHGAFEHGFEAYGVDILRRSLELGRRFGNQFWECYTGAFPPPPPRAFQTVNLLPLSNCSPSLSDSPATPTWTPGEHPELTGFPTGEQTFHEIPFQVSRALALSAHPGYAQTVEIPINARAGAVYLLHTMARGEIAGSLTIHYADGSAKTAYLREGKDLLTINHWAEQNLPADNRNGTRAVLAWKDYQPRHLHVYVSLTGFDADPHKEIRSITLQAAQDGTLWFVLGLTLSDSAVYFPPSPLSYGIPHGWGAAALTYALVEGLAGVVDTATAFESVCLCPRWPAAGVDSAEVTIHYPASDGYAAYRYQLDEAAQRLTLTVTGSGRQAALRLLLPASVSAVNSVLVDGAPVPYRLNQVEESRYLELDLALTGVQTVEVIL
ncbi:MAG: hypothetical protein DDG60_01585 [Anaerolineae bacterium]|nr:MAG: hypothetical protein DDG60_01585 [Anaerolineae bacterium]